jgi:NAD-dependent SIR2 family protein deacetylase
LVHFFRFWYPLPTKIWQPWSRFSLATPVAFNRDPSLVWEFYHYRRELVLTKSPNPAHVAIAECEARLAKEGKSGENSQGKSLGIFFYLE